MNKIKVVRFYKDYLESTIYEKEYVFPKHKKGCGKYIVYDLEANDNMFSIIDIRTKKEVKIYEYTKISNPDEVLTTNFYMNSFKSKKHIFDFLNKDNDLEYINSITTIYVLD